MFPLHYTIWCNNLCIYLIYLISKNFDLIRLFFYIFRYAFSSRTILFLFLNQHPSLFPVRDPRHLIRLNPNSSPVVLSGTFGRDVGRPKAIRRKGMRDDRGSLYVRARAKSGGIGGVVVNAKPVYVYVCVFVWAYVRAYIRSPRSEPSLRRGLRTQ